MTLQKDMEKKELKLNQIEDIKIKLPVTATGKISLKKQKELAELYQSIEQAKDQLEQQLSSISNQRVTLV